MTAFLRLRCVPGVLIAVAVLASAALVRAAESLSITAMVRDDKVLVSFELADAYTDAVREAIASGLRTSFTYELELRTVVPTWLDRTVATAVVSSIDQYDNLTRRHTLTRTVDGRVEDVTVTESDQVVKAWLTTWNRLALYSTTKLDPARDYYVRISARARPASGSLIGWARAVTGQAKFTVIP